MTLYLSLHDVSTIHLNIQKFCDAICVEKKPEFQRIADCFIDLMHVLARQRDEPFKQLTEEDVVKVFRIAFNCMSYDEYLKTQHWAMKRKESLDRSANACAVCCSSDSLNVHHRTYANIGCENDHDLIVLCRSCHDLFHKNKKLAVIDESGRVTVTL